MKNILTSVFALLLSVSLFAQNVGFSAIERISNVDSAKNLVQKLQDHIQFDQDTKEKVYEILLAYEVKKEEISSLPSEELQTRKRKTLDNDTKNQVAMLFDADEKQRFLGFLNNMREIEEKKARMNKAQGAGN